MLKRYFVPLALLSGVLAFSLSTFAQQQAEEKKSMPVEKMVTAILADPNLAGNSFYYDNGFKAVGSFAVHDHFGKRICMGYLVSDGKRLAYRYIRAMPAWDRAMMPLKPISPIWRVSSTSSTPPLGE